MMKCNVSFFFYFAESLSCNSFLQTSTYGDYWHATMYTQVQMCFDLKRYKITIIGVPTFMHLSVLFEVLHSHSRPYMLLFSSPFNQAKISQIRIKIPRSQIYGNHEYLVEPSRITLCRLKRLQIKSENVSFFVTLTSSSSPPSIVTPYF